MATSDSIATTEVEYRDIPRFPGYRVGSDGSVWSRLCRRGNGNLRGFTIFLGSSWKRLKTRVSESTQGYESLTLWNDGVSKQCTVHRLVMLAFHGPCPNGMEVAHENGIRSDSRLCNLSYKTHSGNEHDKARHGTSSKGGQNPNSILTEEQVLSILAEYVPRKNGCKVLGEKYGVHPTAIGHIVNGKNWSHLYERHQRSIHAQPPQ